MNLVCPGNQKKRLKSETVQAPARPWFPHEVGNCVIAMLMIHLPPDPAHANRLSTPPLDRPQMSLKSIVQG